jgi:hypothetical protein
MTYLDGIDVSQWQSATPPLVGQAFGFARATYGTGIDIQHDKDGVPIPGTGYVMHSANIRKAGLVLGAYAFGIFGDGPAQALAFLEVAHDADLLALDLEAEAGKPPMTEAQARAFIAAVHGVGRKIGLYHSASGFPFVGQDWDWVAVWGSVAPTRKWTFWQWQGSPLDRDRFNGTLADLHKLAGIAGGGEVVGVSDPTPKIVNLAVGVQLYATDGKTPLVKLSSGGTDLYSPFGFNAQRAVVISTGGVRQIAMVAAAACTNVRPFGASGVTVGGWTVNGKPISSGSVTFF